MNGANVEIQEVSNGWIVFPSRERREGTFTSSDKIKVFNDFNELSTYLESISNVDPKRK